MVNGGTVNVINCTLQDNNAPKVSPNIHFGGTQDLLCTVDFGMELW